MNTQKESGGCSPAPFGSFFNNGCISTWKNQLCAPPNASNRAERKSNPLTSQSTASSYLSSLAHSIPPLPRRPSFHYSTHPIPTLLCVESPRRPTAPPLHHSIPSSSPRLRTITSFPFAITFANSTPRQFVFG